MIGSGILFTAATWSLLVVDQFLTSFGTAFTSKQLDAVTYRFPLIIGDTSFLSCSIRSQRYLLE